MFQRNDLEISSSSRENVDLSDHGLQSHDLETFHAACKAQIGSISVIKTRA